MELLQTPDSYFHNLPNYKFSPHFAEDLPNFQKMRMHYIDEGSANETFLCLHGQPTWSYLYRKMIPMISSKGFRVVAPDLYGFGKSDKPVEEKNYTFNFHLQSLIDLIEHLDLKNITLVCQDWGGLLGLNLPPLMPTRFKRLIVMNTFLPTGDIALTEGFYNWRTWNKANPDMKIGRLMKRSVPALSEEECLAYEAPFPGVSFKAGVRSFPNLVPEFPDSPGAEISRKSRLWWKNEWTGKAFMAIGMKDAICGEIVMKALHESIRNCSNPLFLSDAGHFVQEQGEEVLNSAFSYFGI